MTNAEWYAMHKTGHAHCPFECEHPQPFMDGDDLVCGRCWFVEKQRTPMVPCTPGVCD